MEIGLFIALSLVMFAWSHLYARFTKKEWTSAIFFEMFWIAAGAGAIAKLFFS